MKPATIAVRYAIVTALLMIAVDAGLHMASLDLHTGYALIGTAVLIAGVILCCVNFSKANEGYITFGQAFVCGLIMVLIVAGILAVWNGLKFVIWPEMRELMIEKSREQMARQGQISDEQRAMTTKMMNAIASPGVVAVISFFSTAFTGTIFALIGGAVAKKNGTVRPEYLDIPGGYSN